MPSEIRAVTDANWAGEPGGATLDVAWMDFFLVIICWRPMRRTQQFVALSTAESEHISITKGAVLALDFSQCYGGVWDDAYSGV